MRPPSVVAHAASLCVFGRQAKRQLFTDLATEFTWVVQRLLHFSLSSLLKNGRMDASSVRFQLVFARMRRPSYVFQQTVRPRTVVDETFLVSRAA